MNVEILRQHARKVWLTNMYENNVKLNTYLRQFKLTVRQLEMQYSDLLMLLPFLLRQILSHIEVEPNVVFSTYSYTQTRPEIDYNLGDIHPTEIVLFSKYDLTEPRPIILFCSVCMGENYLNTDQVNFCKCWVVDKYDNIICSNLRTIPIYNQVEYPIAPYRIRFQILNISFEILMIVLIDYKVGFRIHECAKLEDETLMPKPQYLDFKGWKIYSFRTFFRNQPREVFRRLLYPLLHRVMFCPK